MVRERRACGLAVAGCGGVGMGHSLGWSVDGGCLVGVLGVI